MHSQKKNALVKKVQNISNVKSKLQSIVEYDLDEEERRAKEKKKKI